MLIKGLVDLAFAVISGRNGSMTGRDTGIASASGNRAATKGGAGTEAVSAVGVVSAGISACARHPTGCERAGLHGAVTIDVIANGKGTGCTKCSRSASEIIGVDESSACGKSTTGSVRTKRSRFTDEVPDGTEMPVPSVSPTIPTSDGPVSVVRITIGIEIGRTTLVSTSCKVAGVSIGERTVVLVNRTIGCGIDIALSAIISGECTSSTTGTRHGANSYPVRASESTNCCVCTSTTKARSMRKTMSFGIGREFTCSISLGERIGALATIVSVKAVTVVSSKGTADLRVNTVATVVAFTGRSWNGNREK